MRAGRGSSALIVVLSWLLGACSQPTPPPAREGMQTEAARTIVFVPKSTDVSYWLFVKRGVEDAARELGYRTDYQGVPRETDIAQQVDLVRNIVARRPAGIVLAAVDARALIPALENAANAGIPVVTVDSGVDSNLPAAHIATDNMAAAAEAARWLAKAVGGRGKVGDLGILAGSQTGSDRERGFVETVTREFPGIRIVPVQYTACDPARALNIATDILTANPDLAGFYSACGPNGLGIAQAVRAAGRHGKVRIITFDPNPEVVPLFEQGIISAMIAQDPYQMGYQGVRAVDMAIREGKVEPKTQLIPARLIVPENYQDPQIQKLVRP